MTDTPELSAFIQGLLVSSRPRSGFKHRPAQGTKPRREQEGVTAAVPARSADTSNVIPIRPAKDAD